MCPEEHGRNAEKIMLLLRVLFEVPRETGHMPPCQLGAFTHAEPEDPKLVPRFPIFVISDVPLFLVLGYTLEGLPPSARSDLNYFRKHGQFRAKPLSPPNNPLSLLRDLERTAQ